jgi:hypothetical protein
MVLEPHLMPDNCVANRFKMLTYWRVRSAFESVCALFSNIIWGSKTNLCNLHFHLWERLPAARKSAQLRLEAAPT